MAFFLPSLEPGGAERNVVNLVNNFDKKKYAVSLVLGRAEGDFIKEISKSIPVIDINSSYGSLSLLFKLIKYFKKEKPDIFVSSFSRINIISILARGLSQSKTKIIATEHAVFSSLPVIAKTFWHRIFARFFLPAISRFIYPKAELIICVSKGIAEDISKAINCRGRIKTIYNPIVNDKIYKLAQEPVNHPWFSDYKIPVIVAAGRLVKCKDYPNLFRAFGIIFQKQPVRLVILGRGPEKYKLKQLADELGLSKNIAFLGFQENPYKYMKKASVFVLSSLQEGFGNVIVEAMACGAPVVATDCPTGPGEIIENMKSGILVPVGDEKSLAAAILKILNNPGLAEKFSAKGKLRAECFSVKKSVEEYENIFKELLNQ